MCFFFNDTATTEIYTLSLHDALPICPEARRSDHSGREPSADHDASGLSRRDEEWRLRRGDAPPGQRAWHQARPEDERRSEEHTSELQSRQYLVCRLLLEKKRKRSVQH